MKSTIVIGTGNMSREYIKVLNSLEVEYDVIGRSTESCDNFFQDTRIRPQPGGISKYFTENRTAPENAIIAISVEGLYECAIDLLEHGVRNILIEKPGALKVTELKALKEKSDEMNATIKIAYNRRFYQSIIKLQKLIQLDGGVRSIRFELTEWSHLIQNSKMSKAVLNNWFLANTSHVLDTGFFLGGIPSSLSCVNERSLDWHPNGSIFVGCGKTTKGALFSYHADWESAGRWSIELTTAKRKYVLAPMEKLQCIEIGSVKVENIDINDEIDTNFKPGLYHQVESFLAKNFDRHCDINSQIQLMPYYSKIAGYEA